MTEKEILDRFDKIEARLDKIEHSENAMCNLDGSAIYEVVKTMRDFNIKSMRNAPVNQISV